MMTVSRTYLLLLALAATPALIDCQGPVTPPKVDLDKSFVLGVRIHKIKTNTILEVLQKHSAWQKRSKINLEMDGAFEGGTLLKGDTIYADNDRLLMLDTKHPEASCSSISQEYVDSLFNLDFLEGFESGHLVGITRLLAFVNENVGKFTSSSLDGDRKRDTPFRPTFMGQFRTRRNDDTKVFLIYDSIIRNRKVPSDVVVETAAGALIRYEFLRFESLPDNFQQDLADFDGGNSNSGASEVEFDMFALKKAIGCSRTLKDAQGDSPILATRENYRFSFAAKSRVKQETLSWDVIYDRHLSALRIDLDDSLQATTAIADYNQNRMYHLLRERTSDLELMLDSIKAKPGSTRKSCIINRIVTEEQRKKFERNPFTLGKMLVGTDRLTYLGLARVRGIEARVYEWHDCEWPVWLQHPAVYEMEAKLERNPQTNARNESLELKRRNLSLTNVLYFSKTEEEEEKDLLKAKLLLVEIHTIDDRLDHVLRLRSYPIYDFTWDLPNTGPRGARYEDSFSLQDECLATMKENNQASVELVLEAKLDYENRAWLTDRAKRNTAILQLARDKLYLPSPMLFDVESRFHVGSEMQDTILYGRPAKLPSALVAINFRAASRSKELARLVFVGKAYLRSHSNQQAITVQNFQACQMLAAHQGEDVIFGYKTLDAQCFLVSTKADAYVKSIKQESIVYDKDGWLEVFQILHLDEVRLSAADYLDGFAHMHYGISKLHDLPLFNPAGLYVGVILPGAGSVFNIKHFKLSMPDEKTNYDLGAEHLSDSNKFSGVGLVETDAQNKLVEFRDATGSDHALSNGMSFEHCQTACLTDLECRTFSTCFIRGKSSCVISKVSFSPSSMVLQLMLLSEKKTKIGEKSPITVDADEQKGVTNPGRAITDTIQVLRHPTCELHNKPYRDLFSRRARMKVAADLEDLKPVAHFEECAKLCFESTVQFMQDKMQFAKKDDILDQKLGELPIGKICNHFFYVDLPTVVSSQSREAKQILSDKDALIDGYCVLKNSWHDDKKTIMEDVQFESFVLDHTFLYNKQFGVSLVDSRMTPAESAARSRMEQDLPAGDLVLRASENFGNLHIGAEAKECARQCFEPLSQVAFPVCQSFDYIEASEPNKPIHRVCAYNSITLETLLKNGRTDLVRYGVETQEILRVHAGDHVKVWHYEPRLGIASGAAHEVFNIRPVSNPSLHMTGFGLFCVVLLTLSLSTTAGLILGKRLIGPKSSSVDVEVLINDFSLVNRAHDYPDKL